MAVFRLGGIKLKWRRILWILTTSMWVMEARLVVNGILRQLASWRRKGALVGFVLAQRSIQRGIVAPSSAYTILSGLLKQLDGLKSRSNLDLKEGVCIRIFFGCDRVSYSRASALNAEI
jgi:hypothetical protein